MRRSCTPASRPRPRSRFRAPLLASLAVLTAATALPGAAAAQGSGGLYEYGVAGNLTLKGQISGPVTVSGRLVAELDTAGAYTGDLTLTTKKTALKLVGVVPVDASVSVTPTGRATGTITRGTLALAVPVRFGFRSVSLLGLKIAGGGACKAKATSTIALHAAMSPFEPLDGGALEGTFSLGSGLTSCGSMGGLAGTLLQSRSGTAALTLTPGA